MQENIDESRTKEIIGNVEKMLAKKQSISPQTCRWDDLEIVSEEEAKNPEMEWKKQREREQLILDKNHEEYWKIRDELMKINELVGKYVAFRDGKVVDISNDYVDFKCEPPTTYITLVGNESFKPGLKDVITY